MAVPDSNPIASKSQIEQGDTSTPEDVATLYSWANLHGAKYRDFSASRAQAREEARLRVEEALAEQRRREEEEAERQRQEEAQIAARLAAEAAETARQAEAERLAEIARQAEAERQAVLAAQEAQRQAAQQRAWQPALPESHPGSLGSPFAAGNPQPSFPQASAQSPNPASICSSGPSGGQPFAPSQHAERVPIHSPSFSSEPQRTVFPSYSLPAERAPEYPPAPYPTAVSNQSGSSQSGYSNSFQVPSYPPPASVPNAFPDYPAPQYALPQYPVESFAAPQAESYQSSPWHPAELREPREFRDAASRPAWLAPELPSAPAQQPSLTQYAAQRNYPVAQQTGTPIPMYAQGPGQGLAQGSGQGPGNSPNSGQNSGFVDDTLAGSRDRIANRWYALKSVFDPQSAPEPVPSQPAARVPVLAVFSLAGGVGKTSLVASLGRALSSRGERILLVDTAAYGLLPFFFGARDQRPGMLRTFNPPGVSTDAPIQLVTLDPEGQPPERSADPGHTPNQDTNQDWLASEVARYTRGANRVLVDLPTASGSTTRRVLRLAPVVLVPVLPDMNSVVSVGAIEAFFRNSGNVANAGGKQIMPYYVLNQFDYSLPLHLDVREILREQIGDRLLPFALRRSPAVSEALAEGMTVMDYAPNAVVAEDYANLAGWVRSLNAPATQTYRGVRWSER
ncbi:cellulose biosynthesis protein BcsQ [Acidicapsa acidisoli]|uniref:cellulose biosynthesis protein BcsQ n=1 Tax=Acidicapsa acidisoli TaxID=1615681 RepID=UPI0021DF7082|nr:cellulose biosynthesis protein BcsQ [Acidicapsa acidisoli]